MIVAFEAKITGLSLRIPSNILQIHSMDYKNPSFLPGGAGLVIGTRQSGAQIAEELYQSGRISRPAVRGGRRDAIAGRTSMNGLGGSAISTRESKN